MFLGRTLHGIIGIRETQGPVAIEGSELVFSNPLPAKLPARDPPFPVSFFESILIANSHDAVRDIDSVFGADVMAERVGLARGDVSTDVDQRPASA